MTKTASTLLIAVLTTTVLAGCGLRSGETEAEAYDGAELTPVSAQGAALAALGYHPGDVAPGYSTDRPRWRPWRHRHGPRRNLLHGEVVVQTTDGPRTVLVQRGELTEISDDGVTVTSTDAFVQSWTYGEELRVFEARDEIDAPELAVGTEVGIAGHDRDGTPIADLIVIPSP